MECQDCRELRANLERTRRLFDLDADSSEISRHLGEDSLLAPVVSRYPGLRVPGAWDGFELAVRAILGQQVSVAAARTLAGRIVERWGGGTLFPSPAALAEADLTGAGVTGARARAIRGLAAATAFRRGHVWFSRESAGSGGAAHRARRSRRLDRAIYRHARIQRAGRIPRFGPDPAARGGQPDAARTRSALGALAALASLRGYLSLEASWNCNMTNSTLPSARC